MLRIQFGTYCKTYGGNNFISDAVKTRLLVLRRFKPQRFIVDAPWYIRNTNLHRDLQMEMVTNEIGKFTKKREERLLHHVNFEAIQRRRLRVASGVTAPGPALEGPPRFKPKVVLMSLSSYILR